MVEIKEDSIKNSLSIGIIGTGNQNKVNKGLVWWILVNKILVWIVLVWPTFKERHENWSLKTVGNEDVVRKQIISQNWPIIFRA